MKKEIKFDEKTALKFARAAGIDQKKVKQERDRIWREKQSRVLTRGF